ncbi:MAG: LLM class flavin-dependent oxidoreductase [Pseudomonadales bacterium]|jgi:alkanesulfonate monooxygenase SsuD/methylene tetrahydromethanopterin reductase-like flavin-dependent oxidoreductase (luciferase family)|nr:LLM class flavin-dependent oxidoreductase [Pseudomonadales bacterium]MDP6470468.1 LLM class flavin-dependent oxidoreductase [Pseudomonadales bacterium]MDP6827770.1 LLM class flavin-dependent oxidoreductase [Pseudomonadales bacterium]MDP6973412.1 LLM class flavin-dependent oxidoreductase [Pseudomonadales bacterium]
MPDLHVGVCYDFRNPPDSGRTDRQLYAQIMEQVRWLDQIGANLVWFTEHHFVEDGYLPSWTPVAGAMAAVTENVRFGTDICLLPFNHPVRLAEDLAVLDNLSGGRVEVGVGMGYAPHEFRGFGFPVSRRVSLMDEGIEVLQRCFTGEKFSYKGKRYQLNDVLITPGYVQEGGPPLWIASMSEAGATRAARYDTHFLPQGLKKRSFDPWKQALEDSGRDPRDYRVGIIRSILVTGPDGADWSVIRAAERYRMALYARFFEESGEGFGEKGEPVPQTWIVGDVQHCVDELVGFIKRFGITDIVTMALPPGLDTEQMAPSLERLFRDVVPQVRERLAATA